MNTVSGEFVPSPEAAQLLGISRAALRGLVHRGRLVPTGRLDRTDWFDTADLMRLRWERERHGDTPLTAA